MAASSQQRLNWGARTSRMVLLAILILVILVLGLIAFVDKIPTRLADKETQTDAIVVLTGGSERLDEGLLLLTQKRAKKLFVSGVYRGVDVQRLLELSKQNREELRCCVALGYDAISTEGNAIETRAWLESEGYSSVRLVTANYHLPRSMMEFHHVMPGIRIIPHAVFPEQFKRDNWWLWPGTLNLILSEYMKFIMSALRQTYQSLTVAETGA
ncbi:MAG: YdcF family protein [Rhodospirillaceae bacterium]